MKTHTPDDRHRRLGLLTAAAALALMASGCKTAPEGKLAPAGASAGEPAAPMQTQAAQASSGTGPARRSTASTPRTYRRDGASHFYSQNADRIYKGRMPSLLYAVGVTNVEIDGSGRVTASSRIRRAEPAQAQRKAVTLEPTHGPSKPR